MGQHTQIGLEQIVALQSIVGDPDRVVWKDIPEEYSHDELGGNSVAPEVVVKASCTEEVAGVMRYAYEHNIPVTPRGAGTGLVGACVPVEHGIVLDLSGMKRILELDESNLTLTVQPGVLLMELASYVEDRGLFYPPDPGEKSATIGGNISTNAGGMRAVKYGVTRDWVRGLTVVLPTGEVLKLGGKVVKNSSGYDLKDLFVGSEGTLGIITEAILRLIPKPAAVVSLLVPFPTLQKAIDTVPAIVASQSLPTAIEFMEREVILDAEKYLGKRFPDQNSEAYLLLKFDGASLDEVEHAYAPVADLCLEHGATDVFISDTEEREDSIWGARGAFLEAIKGSTTEMDEVDTVVPRSQVNEMVAYFPRVSTKYGLRIKSFGHAGDGNLHAYLLRDDLSEEEFRRRLAAAMAAIYQKATELGGFVSGEHGIGLVKRPYLLKATDPAAVRLMVGIKHVFDPKNLLNPGKVFETTQEEQAHKENVALPMELVAR
jgi:glycolate oxidase